MEKIEGAEDWNQEVKHYMKHYIPDFTQLANVACRVLENYLKVHRHVGYYKESFSMAIAALLKLYAATGNSNKLSKLIMALPDYLPAMLEALPKISEDSAISMFNFEFNNLAYELQMLGQIQPD